MSSYETICNKNGKAIYIKEFLDSKKSLTFQKVIKEKTKWRKDKIRIFGREVDIPRFQAWYGEKGCHYTYSNITLIPETFYKELNALKILVEEASNSTFNSCLLNLYETGKDYSAWHADNEIELGKNPTIASLSFGGTRMFHLRHNETKETIKYPLESGSLLIMRGELQHFWKHQLAKTMRPVEERINLTFRNIQKKSKAS